MFITWFQLAMYECYCRFLICVSSQPRSCMYVIVEKNQSILFLLCASSQPRPYKYMYVFLKEVQSIFQYAIIQLATTMHEGCCRREPVYFFLLCPSNQPRPCMNIIIKENQFIFLLCSSIYLRPRLHVIGQVLQSIFFHYVLPASHNHDECITLVVRSLFLLCFQLATTM